MDEWMPILQHGWALGDRMLRAVVVLEMALVVACVITLLTAWPWAARTLKRLDDSSATPEPEDILTVFKIALAICSGVTALIVLPCLLISLVLTFLNWDFAVASMWLGR